MTPMMRSISSVLLALAAGSMVACSTSEQKVETFNKRGQALMEKGDLVKARLEFQNALQINPSAVPALYGLALVAERTRDWESAYHLLVKIVEMQPSHFDAQVRLGKLLLASGQLDEALRTSTAVLAARPDSADALALRAAVLLKLDDKIAAVTFANQALAKDAHHLDALVVLASERLHAGDAETAISFLDRGLEKDERNVSLQIIKAQAFEKIGRLDKAEDVLRRLIQLFPENTDYRFLLASFHTTHKQNEKAEAEYRAIVANQPAAHAPKLELVNFLRVTKGISAAADQLAEFIRTNPKAYDLQLGLAGLRLQQGNQDAAVALWKRVIADGGTDPSAQKARGAFASYHLGRQNKAAAKSLVQEMLDKDVREEQALFLRASMGLDEGLLDAAVADLRTILRDNPESARSHLLLARVHERQGLSDLATQHYAHAAQASRHAPVFALAYAEHLMKSGRPRLVEGVLRETLKVAPTNTAVLRVLAQSYLQTGNLAAAQTVADEAARLGSDEMVATQIRGAVSAARRDFGSSIASFRRAYELAPADDAHAMVTLVRSYLVANKQKEAISFLQSVLATSPQNHAARVLYGQLLAQAGQVGEGRAVLNEAARLAPKSPLPYQALANVLLASNDLPGATEAVNRGLQALPDDFGLRVTRAGLLEMQGQTAEAIASYEALLTERPHAIVVANNLASLLADHPKDSASLRRAYDMAQQFRNTNIPQLKDTVGWTMHLAGKHREATDLLKSAADEAPELAVAHYHYGMNQLALSNTKAAAEALRKAIELSKSSPFPQVDDARRALQSL